jgi:hypothetical protein
MKFQETSMRPIMKSLLLLATLAVSTSGYAGEVTRAMFTIGVDNREPVIMVDSIDSSSYTSISFFTELQDLSGNNITHQWTFNGDVMFEKTFEVKGPRWRIWTSKTAPKKTPRPIAGFSYVWIILSDRFVALAKTPLDRPYLVF